MIFGKTTVRDDLLLGSLIVLVLAVVLPTSPRRLKLQTSPRRLDSERLRQASREATSGGLSSKRPGLVTKVIDLSTGVAEPWMQGSRFIMWQLYRLLAGGSRERLDVWQFYRLQ
jgi:hypothetical protein